MLKDPGNCGLPEETAKGGFMNILTSFKVYVAALALLAPAAIFAAQAQDATSIPKLLQQVKDHAAQAKDDAAFLDSHSQSNLDWRMHAQYLQNVKDHANDLLQDYYQLQTVRDKGTPLQQEAIDRLEPLLRDMGTSLTNTFQKLNEHPGRVNMPSFRTQVHADYESINKVYEFLCECTKPNPTA